MRTQNVDAPLAESLGQIHRFRIGIDAREATEFNSNEEQFAVRLTEAIIEHTSKGRPTGKSGGDSYWDLQILCPGGYDWRNCQNPQTYGVVAITQAIVTVPGNAEILFNWCCLSVDKARKLDRFVDLMIPPGTDV